MTETTLTSAVASVFRQIARDAAYHGTGVCTRGVPGLMTATAYKRRTIQLALRWLVQEKFIERVRFGRYTNYRVTDPDLLAAAPTMLHPRRGRRVTLTEIVTRARPKPTAPMTAPRSQDPKNPLEPKQHLRPKAFERIQHDPRSNRDPNPKTEKIDLQKHRSKINSISHNQPVTRARAEWCRRKVEMGARYRAKPWQMPGTPAWKIMREWWEHRHPGKTFSADPERRDGSFEDWEIARQCSFVMVPERVAGIIREHGHKMKSLAYAKAIGVRELNQDRVARDVPVWVEGEDAMGAEKNPAA